MFKLTTHVEKKGGQLNGKFMVFTGELIELIFIAYYVRP